MKKLLLLIPFILVGLLAGLYTAYRCYQDLPGQSLQEIRTSIAEHDWETFRTYVDVDAIVEAAAEPMLTERMNRQKDVYSMQQLKEEYEKKVKPEFLQSVKQGIQDYIKKGRIEFPEDGNLPETMLWMKQAEFNSMRIANISKPIINHGEADIVVNFENPELKTSFEIEAHLVQQPDGTWKITKLSKLSEFSKEVAHALQLKLDRLNAPIQQQMEAIAGVGELDAEIGQGDEYGFSDLMHIVLHMNIQSDKPLAQIDGQVVMEPEDGEPSYAPFSLDMAYHPTGEQTFRVEKVLNPFVRSDVNIMRHGLRKEAMHTEITGITFLDGTRLELMTALPKK